jgi:hypothetical protein
MRLGNFIKRWRLTAVLCAASTVATISPCLAQRSYYRLAQGRPQAQIQRPHQGHAGDWLRRYQGLSPAEREHMLQNDPGFRRLPPERQELLRQRLEHFASLPREQQDRVINRMETWEHLTPGQKDEARGLFQQMRQLPPERQRMVRAAVKDLSAMPLDQRLRVIDSPRFKSMFSPEERDIMRGAAQLPLAPPGNREESPSLPQ